MVLQFLIRRAELLAAPEERRKALENAVAAWVTWFLSTFSLLQDWLLGWERFCSLVLRAFQRRYEAEIEAAVVSPPSSHSFEALEYYVHPDAKQLLQFAGLHALSVQLTSEEALAPSQLLPCMSRVLLQTEEKNSARYLEAVAAALARSMHAALLPVDGALLSRLASVPFSAAPDLGAPPADADGGGSLGSSSGGGGGRPGPAQLRLAWQALRRGVNARSSPTVVFLRAADKLLCASREAHEAFSEAWGSPELLALEGAGARAPVVLVAGCTLSETGAGVMEGRPKAETNGGSEGSDEDGPDGVLAPKQSKGGGLFKGLFGGDDLFGDDSGLGALLRELEAEAAEQKPNPRRVLSRLFPTRAKLRPPPSGPAALRHQQRLARDALEAAEDGNHRAARASAVSAGVRLPPKSSGIYGCSTALPKSEWDKVLAWAVTMQLMQQEQEQGEKKGRRQQQGQQQELEGALAKPTSGVAGEESQQEHANGGCGAGKGSDGAAGPEAREGDLPLHPPSPGFRGGGSPSGASSIPASAQQRAETLNAARQNNGSEQAAGESPLSGVLWAVTLARGALLAFVPPRLLLLLAALAGQLQALAPAALQPLAVPLAGGLARLAARATGPSQGSMAAQRAERQSSLAPRGSRDVSTHAASPAGASALGTPEAGTPSAVPGEPPGEAEGGSLAGGDMQLSPRAVLYGLGMLRRAGGALKQGVRPANSFEKKLLEEVLSPEECGGGFSEVGALEDAKRALREAVQLPLQHPHLFGGALARPAKGVLMFGPPGTGKTLLARAAAAECGASFLGINPSSVASKWLGDGVRLIRAAFSLASKLSPCVIFVDEVDALLGRRNSLKEHEALREMKNEFAAQWDGIRPGDGSRVMVLGATNRPFDIDEAMLRRFTTRVFVGLPGRAARRDILGVVLAGEALAPDVDLARVAEATEGYSGSDLRQLCVQAAMRPVRELLEAEGKKRAAAESRPAPEPGGLLAQGARSEQGQRQLPAGEGSRGAVSGQPAAPQGETSRGACGGAAAAGQGGGEEGASDGGGGGEAAPQLPGPDLAEEAGDDESAPFAPQQLGQLLAAAEGIAGETGRARSELRPIYMQDFEEARREVTATVDPESQVIQELNEWNSQYGTVGSKRGVENKRLSYYL